MIIVVNIIVTYVQQMCAFLVNRELKQLDTLVYG